MNTQLRKETVAVLGSGVSGLHLALSFSEAGYPVTVYSSPKEVPASLASHGFVCHKGLTLARDPLFSDKLEGVLRLRARISSLEEALKKKIPLVEGVHEVYRDENEALSFRQRTYHRRFTGALQSEFLDKKALRPRAPLFFDRRFYKTDPVCGYSYPFDFSFDSLSYLSLLKSLLEQKGVVFKDLHISGLESESGNFIVCGEGQKHKFTHVLCALGAALGAFLEGTPFSIGPLSLSFGATFRSEVSFPLSPQSFLLGQKSFTFFEKLVTLGSFKEKPSKSQFLSLYPGFSDDFWDLFFASPSFFTGKRVFTGSRSPLLRSFQLDGGSKCIILTGMYKSGFSLAEIYAERALSLF